MQTNPDQMNALGTFQELVERDLLTVVFENTPEQIFVLDAATLDFVSANPAGLESLGANLPKLRKLRAGGIFRNISAARLERLTARIRRRQGQSISFVICAGNSGEARLRFTVRYVESVKDSVLIFVTDLSTQYQVAQMVDRSVSTAIDSLSDGFVLYDADDRLVYCNERYRELYAISAPAIQPGAKFVDILRYGLQRGQYPEAVGREGPWLRERLLSHQQKTHVLEQQLSDGRWLRIDERATADGGRVGLRIDITEIKKQQELLDKQAHTDDLTGLLNRRGLLDRVEGLRGTLRPDQSLLFMQIDLDRFKSINEVRGHRAGDHVLCECAKILEHAPIRPAAVARIGADEFMLVLRTRRSEDSVMKSAHQLIQRLCEPIMFEGQTVNVGASIGCAFLMNAPDTPAQDAMSGTNIALHVAKQAGGHEAVMFRDAMRDETIRNNAMAEQMIAGLGRDEFEPFFQPQFDTKSGEVIGFEALIRWRNPVEGLVPAFKFLDIAQRAGLTEALDNVVMDRACSAARQLLDWGMKTPKISINMSIAQISDPGIVQRLQQYMQSHNVGAENLRVELLESTLLEKQSSQIVRNVHSLIAAGFPVELDDFGTGHAAIATLRQFAVSRIKIDRSLVQNIDQDAELQVITAAIINLAKRLGIGVLAEGVETPPEQETLQQMGCHRAQGYLHAKPMPLDALHDFLRDRQAVT